MKVELQDLHPQIKKFWTDKYNRISCNENFGKGGIEWFVYYYKSFSTSIGRQIIAFSDVAKEWETIYYFDHVEYSEEEMLRIIKLKSFA